jgi:arylsulfatase A-like enzyme
MCDDSLGRVLDVFDELNLWDDTLLIVNTDHGFLLGEHDNWAKCSQPFYHEIAHTPLFIWDPRTRKQNERRQALVQTIDLPATLLEYFRLPLPADMQGLPLRDTIDHDAPLREAGLFGIHGGQVNLIDGRHVYMRAPVNEENTPLFNYTLMPTHMQHAFRVEELQQIELAEPFPFTKGCRTMRIPMRAWCNPYPFGTLLFDLENDPQQLCPLNQPALEQRLVQQMRELMQANDAPAEQFERLGL